jgi:hypothetical protein
LFSLITVTKQLSLILKVHGCTVPTPKEPIAPETKIGVKYATDRVGASLKQ